MFLFEKDLFHNIVSCLPNINKKVEFVEKCIKFVNIESYDLVRKFAWILSSLYFEKSLVTINEDNINQAMFEIQQAKYFFEQYNHFTNQIVVNPILTKEKFLKKQGFLSVDTFTVHCQQIEQSEQELA